MSTGRTPAERLWAAVFGSRPAAQLREDRVRALVESLPDQRERMAVMLRFGFEGGRFSTRQIGKLLPRSDGGTGVTRQMASKLLRRGIRRLQHSSRQKAWKEAQE